MHEGRLAGAAWKVMSGLSASAVRGSKKHLRVGVLYPAHPTQPDSWIQAEDDYPRLAEALDGFDVSVKVVHHSWGKLSADPESQAHDWLAALKDLADPERLLEHARELRPFDPDVVTWACTSCSFLAGPEGATRHARLMGKALGVPASNTSLAFLAALRAIHVSRVSVASIYEPEISEAFRTFLGAAGVRTVALTQLGSASLDEFIAWGRERLLQVVEQCDSLEADAIVIPETGIHTVAWLDDLEARVNKPVLTANQVTMWDALRVAHWHQPQVGLGSLFRTGSVD